jgi:hypothetical protein
MSTSRRPPGIPDPGPSIQALLATVAALKEAVEILSGARGDSLDFSLRRGDLIALELATEAELSKIERRKLQTG